MTWKYINRNTAENNTLIHHNNNRKKQNRTSIGTIIFFHNHFNTGDKFNWSIWMKSLLLVNMTEQNISLQSHEINFYEHTHLISICKYMHRAPSNIYRQHSCHLVPYLCSCCSSYLCCCVCAALLSHKHTILTHYHFWQVSCQISPIMMKRLLKWTFSN